MKEIRREHEEQGRDQAGDTFPFDARRDLWIDNCRQIVHSQTRKYEVKVKEYSLNHKQRKAHTCACKEEQVEEVERNA